jgi:N-methylhydantoinase A/oxoprolinase/acetone carboxylase beta subunit
MRHKGQINEVEIALPADRLDEGYLRSLADRFYERYERLYGRGSSFRGTPLEIVTFRARASAQTPRPQLRVARELTATISERAKRTPRPIYWADLQRQKDTPIFDGAHLRPGNRIAGPAVIETAATTVVVHPRRTLAVDGFGNFEITFR